MKVKVIWHRPVGAISGCPNLRHKRTKQVDEMDLRSGRKLVPGQYTRFVGLLRKVLAVGYEQGVPVVHLGR